jgi:hypothetical protein
MITVLDIIFLVGILGNIAIFVYALYWALSVRRAMIAKSYRDQLLALIFVIVAVLVFPGPLGIFVVPAPVDLGSRLVSWFVIYTSFMVIFYWVDASLRTAKKSDPLDRDTFGWSKIRIVLWPIQFAVVVYLGFLQAGLIPVWAQLMPLFVLPYLILIACGAIFLPVAARRSLDKTLRRHFLWFGIFFLGLLVVFLGGLNFPFDIVSDLETFGGLFLGGYALYRSAIALAPLKKPTIVVGEP